MKKTSFLKALSLLSCALLIAAMTVLISGCSKDTEANPSSQAEPEISSQVSSDNVSQTASNVLGEGANVFTFTFTDPDGKETEYEIHTDKEIVGEALSELGLIEGEEGQYGLYVKTVGGITLDYDTDKLYWAFYINGEYAMSGVDTTNITQGYTYSFKAEH